MGRACSTHGGDVQCNSYKIFVRKPDRREQLGGLGIDVRMLDWIHLTQNSDQ
jgi:hypothetical protein